MKSKYTTVTIDPTLSKQIKDLKSFKNKLYRSVTHFVDIAIKKLLDEENKNNKIK